MTILEALCGLDDRLCLLFTPGFVYSLLLQWRFESSLNSVSGVTPIRVSTSESVRSPATHLGVLSHLTYLQ